MRQPVMPPDAKTARNRVFSRLRAYVEFWRRIHPIHRWRLVLCAIAGAFAICLMVAQKPWLVAAQVHGKMGTLDYVRIYGWIAGAVSIVLLRGGLAVICPWWSAERPTRRESQSSSLGSHSPRWFWPLVIVAMAITFFYSLPRMSHGFWDDEELNVRTTLCGKFKLNKKTGEMEFKRFDWLETVYGYSKGPNSHTLFSIVSRACEDTWNSIARPQGFPVVEWPFRVPALVFGVLAVAAMALLLKEFGLPGAGVAAAFLLGVHPWNIRYASEARGYSMMVFLVPVLFVFWRRAMITGQWRWWSTGWRSFAFSICYFGAIFVLIVLNLIIPVLFAIGPDCAEPRVTRAGIWFCVNLLAAILTLQLMLPLYAQAKLYFDFVSSQGSVSGWSWVRNTVCFMIGGAPWTKSGEPWAGYPEWLARYSENPVLFVLATSLAIALILIGAVHLIRRGWASATFVVVMLVCPPITFVFAYFKRYLLYENYVIYSLPGVVICAATGVTLAASYALRLRSGQAMRTHNGIVYHPGILPLHKPFPSMDCSSPAPTDP